MCLWVGKLGALGNLESLKLDVSWIHRALTIEQQDPMCVPSCRHQRLGPVSSSCHQQMGTPLPRGLVYFGLEIVHIYLLSACLHHYYSRLFQSLRPIWPKKHVCKPMIFKQCFSKKKCIRIYLIYIVFISIVKLHTHRYIYVPSHMLFHYVLSQNIDYSSLCYTHGLVVYSS